jgi:hypothetical protein
MSASAIEHPKMSAMNPAVHARGVAPVPGLEIPAAPVHEPQQRRRRSPAEMVVLNHQLDRPLGVPDSTGCVAPGQSLPGAIRLDHRRQTAVFLLIGDDHLRPWDVRFLTLACRWLQPPLGIPQPALDSLELAAH